MTKSDLDGNIIFSGVQLKPYKLPLKETEGKIRNYSENENKSRLIFDRELGWSPHNNFIFADSMYIYRKNGVRSGSLTDTVLQQNSIRILLFGDSYMHGDEVKFERTIGNLLEELLKNQNLKAEVLNFAVSGYGIDQAYLRWEKVKQKFKPDIVLFGMQFENIKRNLNIIRPLYSTITEIPFSKPRFSVEHDQISLINNPSNSINDLIKVLSDISSWNFSNYETFYDQRNYDNNFFYNSRLISLISSVYSIILNEHNYYEQETGSSNLALKILNEFKLSVEEENGTFLIIHLPVKENFALSNILFNQLFYDQELIYEPMLNNIKDEFDTIETYEYLSSWEENNSNQELFLARHYSPTANQLIAERICEYLNLNYKNILEN
ncbi:MAG: SGNH/GDSL hydrolase family protein [Bacteroidota bacterium]